MTITPQIPLVTIEGDGVSTLFNYNFEIPYQDDGITPAVAVYLQDGTDDPVLVDPADYTITGIDVESGGSVTYPLVGSALPVGWFIIIARNLFYSNGSAFPNTAFQPRQIENMGDRLAMQIQQLAIGDTTGGGGGGGSGVASFNSRTGAVVLFSADVTGALGYTPLRNTGYTMIGKANFLASTALAAGVNIGQGTAPTSPINGDTWITSAGMFARAGGVTYGPFDTGGGGSFDQNTAYDIGGSTVSRDLVARGQAQISILDYGAVGDGVADDTDALNLLIADVNAGTVFTIYFPAGSYSIEGNVTTITRGCAIFGDGIDATIIIGAGAGTSDLLPVSITPIGTPEHDRITLAGMSFQSAQSFVRRVGTFSWSTSLNASQERLNIRDIDIQKHFKEGFYLRNIIGGNFTNVMMQGGPIADGLMDWGWKITASTSNYSVSLKWTACSTTTAERCWWVTDHAEGFYWTQCEAGFSNYGFYLDISDTTHGPEFHITDCQCEVNDIGIWAKNIAYLYVADYSFYVSAVASAGATCIRLEDVQVANIHNNISITGSALAYNFLACFGATTQVKADGNQIGFLTNGSYGYVMADTTNYVQMTNTHYFSIAGSTASPLTITSSGNSIQESKSTTDSGLIQFSRTLGAGVNTGGTFILTTSLVIAAQVAIPVWKGQKYRVQAEVSFTNITSNQAISLRIREYTHRPSGPSPYTVFETANGLTTIFDITSVFVGLAGRFLIDTEIRIVGSATDALFVLELGTSNTASAADVYSFYMTLV